MKLFGIDFRIARKEQVSRSKQNDPVLVGATGPLGSVRMSEADSAGLDRKRLDFARYLIENGYLHD